MSEEFKEKFYAAGDLAWQDLTADEKKALNQYRKITRQLEEKGVGEDEVTEKGFRLVKGSKQALKKWTDLEEKWRKAGNNE